jgi:hypothetical protein
MRLEGLGELKNPMTSIIEPVTFRLVAYCLNQPRYRVPRQMIECIMNWKKRGSKESWPNLRYYLSWNLPVGIEENHEIPLQGSWCPGRSTPGTSRVEETALSPVQSCWRLLADVFRRTNTMAFTQVFPALDTVRTRQIRPCELGWMCEDVTRVCERAMIMSDAMTTLLIVIYSISHCTSSDWTNSENIASFNL